MTPAERAMLEGLMAGLDPVASFRRPAWMAHGACLEHPEVEFVPLNLRTEENADAARAICAGCACRAECLAYALADDLLGIWAGTTTRERREMRKRRAA